MNITFYNTKDPKEKVVKTLYNGYGTTVQLKAPTDVLKPVIIVGSVDVANYNYCYIPDFKRYYYISDITTDYGNISGRECQVDPLMSYSSQIKALNAIVERQQNFYNLYLPNLQISDMSYSRVQTRLFPQQPLNVNGTLLLAVCGKG